MILFLMSRSSIRYSRFNLIAKWLFVISKIWFYGWLGNKFPSRIVKMWKRKLYVRNIFFMLEQFHWCYLCVVMKCSVKFIDYVWMRYQYNRSSLLSLTRCCSRWYQSTLLAFIKLKTIVASLHFIRQFVCSKQKRWSCLWQKVTAMFNTQTLKKSQ